MACVNTCIVRKPHFKQELHFKHQMNETVITMACEPHLDRILQVFQLSSDAQQVIIETAEHTIRVSGCVVDRGHATRRSALVVPRLDETRIFSQRIAQALVHRLCVIRRDATQHAAHFGHIAKRHRCDATSGFFEKWHSGVRLGWVAAEAIERRNVNANNEVIYATTRKAESHCSLP